MEQFTCVIEKRKKIDQEITVETLKKELLKNLLKEVKNMCLEDKINLLEILLEHKEQTIEELISEIEDFRKKKAI